MTDELDYRKHNPKVLMGNDAEKRMHDKDAQVFGPTLNLFDQEGNPTLFINPTREETLDLLSSISKLVDGQDIRNVILMIQEIEETLESAMYQALTTAHMIAHSVEHRKEFDEDTLCEGVNTYLEPKTADVSGLDKVTAENVGDILSKFFVKPDTKPN
jgi:hypothetical protein